MLSNVIHSSCLYQLFCIDQYKQGNLSSALRESTSRRYVNTIWNTFKRIYRRSYTAIGLRQLKTIMNKYGWIASGGFLMSVSFLALFLEPTFFEYCFYFYLFILGTVWSIQGNRYVVSYERSRLKKILIHGSYR